MTPLKIYLVAFLFSSHIYASESEVSCQPWPPALLPNSSVTCHIESSIEITSSKVLSTSTYATELDNRILVAARSENKLELLNFSGIKKSNGNYFLIRTKSIPIPYSDYITKREPQNPEVFGKWVILREIIQYGSQGSTPGYAIKCATAIRNGEDEVATTVSECYPFDEEGRYLDVLRSAENNTQLFEIPGGSPPVSVDSPRELQSDPFSQGALEKIRSYLLENYFQQPDNLSLVCFEIGQPECSPAALRIK